MAVKKIENKDLILCRGANVEELHCTGMISIDEFSNSWSYLNIMDKKVKGKDGKFVNLKKLPYCKKCNDAHYKRFRDLKMSPEEALFYVCSLNNVPFIAEKVEATFSYVTSEAKRGAKVSSIWGYYYSLLSRETSKHHLWQDFSCTDIDYKDIATHIEKRDIQKKDVEQLELDWGKQSNLDDYALLDYWFDELTGEKALTKAEELSYRDLCLARLSKRKIEQYNPDSKDGAKEDNDVAKVQKQIIDLMKLLRIDNFSENKEKTIVERMLESRINDLEKHDPAQYYDDLKRNADFCGRSKYFYDHIYRPFKNVFTGSRLYKITPEDEDTMIDEDYEKLMAKEKIKKEE